MAAEFERLFYQDTRAWRCLDCVGGARGFHSPVDFETKLN